MIQAALANAREMLSRQVADLSPTLNVVGAAAALIAEIGIAPVAECVAATAAATQHVSSHVQVLQLHGAKVKAAIAVASDASGKKTASLSQLGARRTAMEMRLSALLDEHRTDLSAKEKALQAVSTASSVSIMRAIHRDTDGK